jgi:hypothetical protein
MNGDLSDLRWWELIIVMAILVNIVALEGIWDTFGGSPMSMDRM